MILTGKEAVEKYKGKKVRRKILLSFMLSGKRCYAEGILTHTYGDMQNLHILFDGKRRFSLERTFDRSIPIDNNDIIYITSKHSIEGLINFALEEE